MFSKRRERIKKKRAGNPFKGTVNVKEGQIKRRPWGNAERRREAEKKVRKSTRVRSKLTKKRMEARER